MNRNSREPIFMPGSIWAGGILFMCHRFFHELTINLILSTIVTLNRLLNPSKMTNCISYVLNQKVYFLGRYTTPASSGCQIKV